MGVHGDMRRGTSTRDTGLILGALVCLALLLGGCPDDASTTDADEVIGDVDTTPDVPASSSTLVLEPTSLDFETIAQNDARVLDLELENAGTEPILVTSITVTSGEGRFAANLTQLTLAAGETKVLKVTFFGLAEGAWTDTLELTSNAVNGPRHTVALSGTVGEAVCVDGDGDLHGEGCAAGRDCRDNDPLIFEGAPERCNRDDDDCDNLFDEDFVGLGLECTSGLGSCAREGTGVCNEAGDGVVCSAEIGAGADELCNDVDDDCDGVTDEDFPSKGALCSIGAGACRVVDKYVCSSDGLRLECPVRTLEPKPELCSDAVDNDCDGITDEGRIEVCGDQTDNDCDGTTDESGSRWGELFFARDSGDTVAVYPARGDGTFQEPIVLDFPGDDRYSVHAVGDFDGDRWLDLVVKKTLLASRARCTTSAACGAGFTCAEGVCRKLCVNDGDCTIFPGEQCVDTRSHPVGNDTYCLPERQVFVARSSCIGEDTITLTPLFTLAPGDQLGPVADFDGNGHLDFAGLHDFADGKKGFLWMNDGEGHFTQRTHAFDYGPLYGPGQIGFWSWGLVKSAKDLTGDGHVDILGYSQSSTGSQPTDLWIMAGAGDGTFTPMIALPVDLPLPANLLTVADYDLDGDQDIVGGLDEDGQPGAAFVLLNLASEDASGWVEAYPIFDVAPSWNSGNERPGLGEGTSWDFDSDDQPDILAAWVPEECGSFIFGCTDVLDPNNVCYGGNCRKIGLLRNVTRNPCGPGSRCEAGACEGGCAPDCEGKACGDDGCGGVCGECGFGQTCAGGRCVVDCVPDCEGRTCGDNGCGGVCGTCPGGFSCVGGSCTDDCVPNCEGKACGDDGCGGACAIFSEPVVIAFDANPATALAVPANVPPTRPGVTIDPANPGPNADLTCNVTSPSYDLDPVTYRIAWFRNGVYVKAVGDRARVPAALTEANDTWTCRVVASDGIESSAPSENSVRVQ